MDSETNSPFPGLWDIPATPPANHYGLLWSGVWIVFPFNNNVYLLTGGRRDT